MTGGKAFICGRGARPRRIERRSGEAQGNWAQYDQETHEIILSLELAALPEVYVVPPLTHELQHAYEANSEDSHQEEVRTHRAELIMLAAIEPYLEKLMKHYREDYEDLSRAHARGRLPDAVKERYGKELIDLKERLKELQAEAAKARGRLKEAASPRERKQAQLELDGINERIRETRLNMRTRLKRP